MKNTKIKIPLNQKETDSKKNLFILEKISKFKNMITNTILSSQQFKNKDIIGASELNVCIQALESLYSELDLLDGNCKKNNDTNDSISRLQKINNELSCIFRNFGTFNIEDLITVAFASDFINQTVNETNKDKYELIQKYVHPIGYKVLNWKKGDQKTNKNLAKNRIVEDFMIVESAENFECFDLARTSRKFNAKVYGIKIALKNEKQRKTLIISGLVDDIVVNCSNHSFIKNKLQSLILKKPNDPEFASEDFERFLKILTIKELLIYSHDELYHRYVGYMTQINLIKQKPISQNVKEFITSELYGQRRTLIQLLIKKNEPEFQYLAYLLYDLLSNDGNGGGPDSIEQTILFDSLPWNIKKYFREAMKSTLNYTKDLANFDTNKIPIEQQICLMKANDNVKEKAMIKLKEVKAKSEDSGSKARQFLDGLLKIPFGIYKKEPMLLTMTEIKHNFDELKVLLDKEDEKFLPEKKEFTCIEIYKIITQVKEEFIPTLQIKHVEKLKKLFCQGKRDTLVANICFINGFIKQSNLKYPKLCHSGKKNSFMKDKLTDFIEFHKNDIYVVTNLQTHFKCEFQENIISKLEEKTNHMDKKWSTINNDIGKVRQILDDAIHGHDKAKRQLERIVGQWINGEQKGYCFGFEGAPGIGKTSLAKKGLAKCLFDDQEGKSRPFAFIALGGSCNGSTLSGHNYTYVGSTWGRIVDILMETKCMNPIIFIDELDKVSRSEHGKEIIGILTHLVDSTQNESFQDKYFNGVDLDLSKVLFIFSYNDPALIDRILLDRIHRIKFNNLSVEDKLVIANKYVLPEIYENIGLRDMIEIDNDILRFIIETYTYEPGVRKLKEILFEIISEINLTILQGENSKIKLPIVLTEKDIREKYLSERTEVRNKEIHPSSAVGIMNGLWANALGKGGIIPIECNFFPAQNFLDFKLTGLQGDVMKESMNVAKTLAWKITTKKWKKSFMEKVKDDKMQGIHIHCPEGATPKDGPSAGTAITIAIYSILNNKKIKNTVAITGEISLQGRVTAIGGLDLKILGGIRAGVNEFIFPKENMKAFNAFMEKYEGHKLLEGITFHNVETIDEVLKLAFV